MALGGFFGAFANMISGLATADMQRSDNEYLMNKQAELNKEQADYSTDLAKNYWETDRKSTRLNSSHSAKSRMPSSA